MDYVSLLGTSVGVLGFLYALYQGHEKRKLERYHRSQSWFLYEKANNMTGISQAAYRKYIEKHTSEPNTEVIELLAKSSAFGLEMFRETIRLIELSEPNFNFETIERWQRQGKIDSDHKQLFIPLVVEDGKHKSNECDDKK